MTSPSGFAHGPNTFVTHAPNVHLPIASPSHHFDASHWTSGHFGDAHHFGTFHHDGHHAIFDHRDFHHDHHFFHHHHFFVGGLAFYGWSYPYYYYPYYDYYPYYAPSYYEAPVYYPTNFPPTNAPSGSGLNPGNYQAQATNTRVDAPTRFPDVALPRTELPSREAPEALPEVKTAEPRRDGAPPESPQPNGSKNANAEHPSYGSVSPAAGAGTRGS